MPAAAPRPAVRWLLAQSVAFGVTIAILGVVGFALFLDEYGAEWLPLTYLFIAGAGVIVSGSVAKSVRRWSLVRVATAVLGGAAVLFVACWAIAAFADGAWVSAPLLVLFPVLIQLGFVFIGGQAGQLLDVQAIKSYFPRIAAGFPAGAIFGGLIAAGLVAVVDRAEHLLLATAVAQAVFLALLLATGRRFAAELSRRASTPPPPAPADGGRWRRLPLSGFVGLVFAYQVLSAVASQFADYLVYDRAAARYGDGEELARFIGVYTVVMNTISIAFLVLVAGLLLRRYGLGLGLVANPAVLAAVAAAMVVAVGAGGAGSLGLFAVVVAGRVADVALTDGTTRTSINAAYQVLPDADRLAVQAQVEGVGVPLAIGASGVMIMALNALPAAVTSLIVATLLVSALWTWVAWRVYRGYRGALTNALDRRWLHVGDGAVDQSVNGKVELAAAQRLLRAPSGRDVWLGLDVLAVASSPAADAELDRLVDDERPPVRIVALARRAGDGDRAAASQLGDEIASALHTGTAEDRRAAARGLALGRPAVDRSALPRLLIDPDLDVRLEALGAVGPEDADVVELVIDALGDLHTVEGAIAAVGRLGPAARAVLAQRLADDRGPASATTVRLLRALRASESAGVHDVLRPHLDHPDRELGALVLGALADSDPASDPLAAEVRGVLAADVTHSACIVAATRALTEDKRMDPLRRALADELDLERRRISAALAVLYGRDRLGSALRRLDAVDRHVRGLAVEAIEVAVGRADARATVPILRLDLSDGERARFLEPWTPAAPAGGWLADLAGDPDGVWRSPWLRECAAYALKH